LDVNENAQVDGGEIKPAVDTIVALTVRPVETSDNWFAPKGAFLKTGQVVDTWDWWSGTFYQGKPFEYSPQVCSDDAVLMYRWRQIHVNPAESLVPEGDPPKIPEGYFRFAKCIIGGKPNVMIASISTASSSKDFAELRGSVAYVMPAPGSRMQWSFGELYSQCQFESDGRITGASFIGINTSNPLYLWEAVPVTAFEDDYASSLASIAASEFSNSVEMRFRYYPHLRSDMLSEGNTPKFLTFAEFLEDFKEK
jgi:hypothetical protein